MPRVCHWCAAAQACCTAACSARSARSAARGHACTPGGQLSAPSPPAASAPGSPCPAGRRRWAGRSTQWRTRNRSPPGTFVWYAFRSECFFWERVMTVGSSIARRMRGHETAFNAAGAHCFHRPGPSQLCPPAAQPPHQPAGSNTPVEHIHAVAFQGRACSGGQGGGRMWCSWREANLLRHAACHDGLLWCTALTACLTHLLRGRLCRLLRANRKAAAESPSAGRRWAAA